MPRKARIDATGSVHHIIIRGIERSPIFLGTADYEDFLARLGRLLKETGTSCYAWALMKNHAHLLLRSGPSPLTTLMRRLLTGYATSFNRRHNRSGHLFQNRYKSFLCEEDPYLLELVRYIHLNPIRAGVVPDIPALERFPWSGHSVLVGRERREWQEGDFVLSLFHTRRTAAREAYRAFVEKGIALGRRPDLVGGGLVRSAGGWIAVHALKKSKERFASDERILGRSEFVASVLTQAHEQFARKDLAAIHGVDIERLVKVVCDYFHLEQGLLMSPVKQSSVTRVRAIIASLAFTTLRLRGIDIAERLHLSPAAVSKLAVRGRNDPLLDEIERALFGKKE